MKKLAIVIGLIIVLLVGSYFYVYQDHRDVATTSTSISLTTQELTGILTDNDTNNDQSVLDQVIEVTGIVTNVNDTSIILDHVAFIELVKPISVTIGSEQKIKGRCLGYDDLLGEIKIDQAIINN